MQKSPSYKLVLTLVISIIFRIVLPYDICNYVNSKRLKPVLFSIWFALGYVFNVVLWSMPIWLLNSHRGCDRNPRNRLTLIPVDDPDELYVIATRHYWDRIVESLYSSDFLVHFVDTVTELPISNYEGPYIQLRYDFNFISFTFKYIGTLSIILNRYTHQFYKPDTNIQ